ncbi:MAG: phytanoyl-CoA dioxygenase family protein [Thermoleophilaceae bacterium]
MTRQVTVDEYVRFRAEGFLIVRGLIDQADVEEVLDHMASEDGLGNRVHFLHRYLEIHERFLLHPRLLDVVEGLIGPDVLALQTMLFVKPPGSAGQGYHQDSFHIITEPDTLIGAWVALDRADTENGCLWLTPGSQNEPVYPDADEDAGHGGDTRLAGIFSVEGADDPDESRNGLTPVAAKYAGRERPAELDPGDVVFFGGHVLHRSHANRSADRLRRSFVSHYCNARSLVPWDDDPLEEGEIGNERHILARGSTHLPYAQPLFGTPCAANAKAPVG